MGEWTSVKKKVILTTDFAAKTGKIFFLKKNFYFLFLAFFLRQFFKLSLRHFLLVWKILNTLRHFKKFYRKIDWKSLKNLCTLRHRKFLVSVGECTIAQTQRAGVRECTFAQTQRTGVKRHLWNFIGLSLCCFVVTLSSWKNSKARYSRWRKVVEKTLPVYDNFLGGSGGV